jgi:hypothetical protein
MATIDQPDAVTTALVEHFTAAVVLIHDRPPGARFRGT